MLKRLTRQVVTSSRTFSVAAGREKSGIDDFLSSLSTATPIQNAEEKSNNGPETTRQFTNWLSKNEITSPSSYIEAAKLAVKFGDDEKKSIFETINKTSENCFPAFMSEMKPAEGLLVLRYIMQLDGNSKSAQAIQKYFDSYEFENNDFANVSNDDLLAILKNSQKVKLNENISKLVNLLIYDRLARDFYKPADLLTILTYGKSNQWFQKPAFLQATERLVTVMGLGEKCALLRHMVDQKQRNKKLLGVTGHSIADSSQCLTVSQIVSLSSTCASLSFYSSRLFNKISADLAKNANVLRKWSDVLQISDSFVRMRFGNEQAWETLVRWAIQNHKDAEITQLTRFVAALAKLGIAEGKPLAEVLKPRLKKDRTSSSNVWLNIVHSLAYFQQLDHFLADSVLNKNVVKDIIDSSLEQHNRLRRAMLLLNISECAKIDLEGYNGPTVSKQYFESFGIRFGSDSICQARQMKYSKSVTECDTIFLKNLFKIAPQDSYCKHSDIEECGALVDAYVMPDKEKQKVVALSQWGDRKPRPVFFYGWMQLKQRMSSTGEQQLHGADQLGIRLMRAQNYDPIIVFKSDFDYCTSDVEIMNMLRDKIYK